MSIPIQTNSTQCLNFEELDVDKDFTDTVLKESDSVYKAMYFCNQGRRYEDDNVEVHVFIGV